MAEPRLIPSDYIGPRPRHHVTQKGLGGPYRVRSNPFGAIVDAIKGFCSIAPMTADDAGGYSEDEYGEYSDGGGSYGYSGGGYSGGGYNLPYGDPGGGGQPGGMMDCPTGSQWDATFMQCVPTGGGGGGGGMDMDPVACNPMARMMQRDKLRDAVRAKDLTKVMEVATYAADCVGRLNGGENRMYWVQLRQDADREARELMGGGGGGMGMECPDGQTWDPMSMSCMGMMGGGGDEPASCSMASLVSQRAALDMADESCNLMAIRRIGQIANTCREMTMNADRKMMWRNLKDRADMTYDRAMARCGGGGGGGDMTMDCPTGSTWNPMTMACQMDGPGGVGTGMVGCGPEVRMEQRELLRMAVASRNGMAASQVAAAADRCAGMTMGDNQANWRELARDARRVADEIRMTCPTGETWDPATMMCRMMMGGGDPDEMTGCGMKVRMENRERLRQAQAANSLPMVEAVLTKATECAMRATGDNKENWVELRNDARRVADMMRAAMSMTGGGGMMTIGGGVMMMMPPATGYEPTASCSGSELSKAKAALALASSRGDVATCRRILDKCIDCEMKVPSGSVRSQWTALKRVAQTCVDKAKANDLPLMMMQPPMASMMGMGGGGGGGGMGPPPPPPPGFP